MARPGRRTDAGGALTRARMRQFAKLDMDGMSRRTRDSANEDWVRAWIAWFGGHRPKYRRMAATLQQVLQAAADRLAPLAIVQARAKTLASYTEKLQRKLEKYRKTDGEGRLLHPITDLCGARVITHTLTQVKTVCGFIENHFDIDARNSVDVSTRLRANEFGYLSVHYIVRFRPGVFPTRSVPVNVPAGLCGLDAEVQVRTFLEHAWADISHDMRYKSSFRIPDKWEREFARLAAILEDADGAFCRVESGLAEYAANYGAYMSEERMRAEMGRAEVVLQVDPANVGVAHRIARLAMCLGHWAKVIKVLTPFVDSESAPILRDLGVAMCKRYKKRSTGFRRGQRYLEQAIALEPGDSDAIASLGGTWRGIDEGKALSTYRQAFEANPSDPYPLGNYLECEIARRKDLSPVRFALASLNAAIQKCRNQADVGMNMPWAFYDMGKFHLLLKEPYESLRMYAKAVSVSTSKAMVARSLDSVNRLRLSREEVPGLQWVRRFLALAAAVKFGQGGLSRSLRSLASARRKPLRAPIVVIAGACGGSAGRRVDAYRRLVLAAFRDFSGTVVSGGTTTGVGRLAGDVGASCGRKVRTIGYVPSGATADGDRRRYHEIRRTGRGDFSPLEPLQAWIDILASGANVRHVRVLGFGGGPLAAAEYRIALALGARVGVAGDSGGAVSELVADSDWRGSETLLQLPPDCATIRAFIAPATPSPPTTIRETIARAIHEAYRLEQAQRHRTDEPSTADWDSLLEYLKESNRQQADHIFEKLDALGYVVRRPPRRTRISPREFTPKEIEAMAEMEHGRWNVERILDRWTLGEKKDVARKVSPYLVPWKDLPENVKDWDRQAVRAIPEFLAQVGLEIRGRKMGH